MKLFREKGFIKSSIKSGIKNGIAIMLAIALFSLPVLAQERHLNGFGGVTIINPTGTMIFDTDIMRSEALSQDNLVLAYDMSTTVSVDNDILLYDFSEQENHGTMYPGVTPGSYNESSSADSYVNEQSPTTNYGSSSILRVRSSAAGDTRIFVIWDLSSIPSDATITDAQMILYKSSDGGAFPRTYDAEKASGSWTEGGLNWNNQPGVTGSVVSISITTAEGEYNWSITDFVQDWVDITSTNYGVRIKDQTEGSASVVLSDFHSKEGANDPYLTFNYTIPQSTIPTIASTFGQALDFDGYDDYIDTNLDIPPDNFTLIAVVNPDSTSPGRTGILSKRGLEWVWEMRDVDKIYFVGWDSTSSVTIDLSSSISISIGSSTIIGLTWDGFTACHWIAGSETVCGDRTQGPIDDESVTITISEQIANPDRYWDGPIDEVLIFTDAMDNDSMIALTTVQHQLVIGGGSASIPQRYAGLILALPWLIVAGIMFTMFYIAFLAWKSSLMGEK